MNGTGAVVSAAAADVCHATSPGDDSTMVTADIHYHESATAHPGCVADDGAETEYAAVAPERSHATMVTADDDAGGDRLSDTAGVLATTMPLN